MDFGGYAGMAFPSGSTNGATQCSMITIIDDDILEENENFLVNVTLVHLELQVFIYNTKPLFIITDNDS